MSKDKHFFYSQLTEEERKAVDQAYNAYDDTLIHGHGIYVEGNDLAEIVVDTMARQVIANRDKYK